MSINWEKVGKDDSARALAITFLWRQIRLNATIHDPDDPALGGELQLDLMMHYLSEIRQAAELGEILSPLMKLAWAVIDSKEEWEQLYERRKRKPLAKWYREDYLQSRLWASLREIVLDRDERKCSLCNCRASHVHHMCYDDLVMQGRDIRYLLSLVRELPFRG